MIGLFFTITFFLIFCLAIQVQNFREWYAIHCQELDLFVGHTDRVFSTRSVPKYLTETPTHYVKLQKHIRRY
jgi:hypothetical protein